MIDQILEKNAITPVFIDVGASGKKPEIWANIAGRSVYIGFDPDIRDIKKTKEGKFLREIIINKAVTSEEGRDTVKFYLTRSPHCSSTLRPALDSLSEFSFAELFEIEKEVEVEAITLNRAVKDLELSVIDWLKIDSQGIDLSIFRSLGEGLRSKLLALDVEPGIINAYENEDFFVDTHKYLVNNGFWISRMDVKGIDKIRTVKLRELAKTHYGSIGNAINNNIRKSPAWCEARYLRTTEHLKKNNAGKRDFVLLWVFAMMDKQFGFALEPIMEYEKIFGEDSCSKSMKRETILMIKRTGAFFRKILSKAGNYLLRKSGT